MNSGLKSYKDLELWKVSMDLVVDVYELTTRFPKEEIYGLTSQIRRSCSSIPSNIAEGPVERAQKNLSIFYGLPMALCPNWKLRSNWQKGWDI